MSYVSESARRKLHGQFLITTKRPVFRKANTHRFADDKSRSSCITDVHRGTNSSTGEILVSLNAVLCSLLEMSIGVRADPVLLAVSLLVSVRSLLAESYYMK